MTISYLCTQVETPSISAVFGRVFRGQESFACSLKAGRNLFIKQASALLAMPLLISVGTSDAAGSICSPRVDSRTRAGAPTAGRLTLFLCRRLIL